VQQRWQKGRHRCCPPGPAWVASVPTSPNVISSQVLFARHWPPMAGPLFKSPVGRGGTGCPDRRLRARGYWLHTLICPVGPRSQTRFFGL